MKLKEEFLESEDGDLEHFHNTSLSVIRKHLLWELRKKFPKLTEEMIKVSFGTYEHFLPAQVLSGKFSYPSEESSSTPEQIFRIDYLLSSTSEILELIELFNSFEKTLDNDN